MTTVDAIDRFVADLASATIGRTFNQYREVDPGLDAPGAPSQRQENLRRYLIERARPVLMLVGEAPSYAGCRFSGIAFTCESQLRAPYLPSSVRASQGAPWVERSATTVHGLLEELGLADRSVLWNTVPTHPAGATALSNRRPTSPERRDGVEWARRLIEVLAPDRVIAVGRISERALGGHAAYVRHPSYGGAAAFREQLRRLVADATEMSPQLASVQVPHQSGVTAKAQTRPLAIRRTV